MDNERQRISNEAEEESVKDQNCHKIHSEDLKEKSFSPEDTSPNSD